MLLVGASAGVGFVQRSNELWARLSPLWFLLPDDLEAKFRRFSLNVQHYTALEAANASHHPWKCNSRFTCSITCLFNSLVIYSSTLRWVFNDIFHASWPHFEGLKARWLLWMVLCSFWVSLVECFRFGTVPENVDSRAIIARHPSASYLYITMTNELLAGTNSIVRYCAGPLLVTLLVSGAICMHCTPGTVP